MNNLVKQAGSSSSKLRNLLKEVKGLGDVGIDIFFGTTQDICSFLAPFIGDRNLQTAKKIGLSQDVESLWQDVNKDPSAMCKLYSALTFVRLERKENELTD